MELPAGLLCEWGAHAAAGPRSLSKEQCWKDLVVCNPSWL